VLSKFALTLDDDQPGSCRLGAEMLATEGDDSSDKEIVQSFTEPASSSAEMPKNLAPESVNAAARELGTSESARSSTDKNDIVGHSPTKPALSPKSAEHSLSRISSPLTLRPAEAAGAPSSQSQEVGAEDTGEGDEAAATAGRRWDQMQDGSAGQFQQGAAKSLVVDSVPGWQARAESPEVQLRGSGGTRKVAG
jgi:type II secretory pathway component HofQ